MKKRDSCWINRCVYVVFITFIYAVTIKGAHSQNMDFPQGPLIQNGKEPPDIQILEPDIQNTVPDIQNLEPDIQNTVPDIQNTVPDLQNIIPGQQTIPNFRNGNLRRRKFPLNQRPMKFLCSRRVPMFVSRRNIQEQTTDSPFIVSLSHVTTGGQGLHVEISSQNRRPFLGFMLQVVSSGTSADDIGHGEFLPSPSVNLQSCYSDADTVTSNDRKKKTSASVTWNAPVDLNGNVTVRATIVEDYRTYWLDVLSEEIQIENTDATSTDSTETVTNNTHTNETSSSSNSQDDTGISMSEDVANESTDSGITTADVDIPISLNNEETKDLEKSISETFESFNGPLESVDEVLLHQGIIAVDKVNDIKDTNPDVNYQHAVIIRPPTMDDAPTAPQLPPRYIYRTMNQFAPAFEAPQTSEFIGSLLNGMSGAGGGRGPVPGMGVGGNSGGGLGSMMNMMGMASNLFGGGGGGGGGGGSGGSGVGGMMNTLGTLSKLSGMMGTGNRGNSPSGGGMGGLGTLRALSSMGSMFGGGGGGGGGNPLSSLLGGGGGGGGGNIGAASPMGGGLGGLGALSSLIGGMGKKNRDRTGNVAPMPTGAAVHPNTNNEPSLADLLGVDPSIVIDPKVPIVIAAEANPLAGIKAAKASGGMLSKVGGFAPMLAMAPLAFKFFGGKKKKQQSFGMPGQQGQFGGAQGQFGRAPGQFGGAQGQFGRAPGQFGGAQGQFGRAPGQFGGAQGQFGGAQGQFGGAQGQFGGAQGQFGGAQGQFGGGQGQFGGAQGQLGGAPGQFGGAPGQFGATTNQWQTTGGLRSTPPTNNNGWHGSNPTDAHHESDIHQIIQLLEAQRLQIEALKNQIGGSSITSQMGGFGNIPLSLGHSADTHLLGLSGNSGLSGFGGLSTLGDNHLAPTGPPKQVHQQQQTSPSQDLLLQQLMKQNQLLMSQNQQFQTNLLSSNQGHGQVGATGSNSFNRVNRSNGQMVNTMIPSSNLHPNVGQNNFQQRQGQIGGQGTGGNFGQFPGTGHPGQNNFGLGMNNGQNNIPHQGSNPFSAGNFGGSGAQSPAMGGSSLFGQFSGSHQGGGGPSHVAATGGSLNHGVAAGGGGSGPGPAGGGGGLGNMFGGGGSGGAGGVMSGLMGGNGGGGGGGGNGGLDIGSILGNIDPSALQGMLGGSKNGGGLDVASLLGNVDMNAMSGLLNGKGGQDLMKSMTGMLNGPQGGDLMKAMDGMMSGNGNPADITSLLGNMDIGELQNMAKQAEGLMASTGIDPAQILSMMG